MLKSLESRLGRYFNIMAFIRTLVCVIFLVVAVGGCGTIECVYTQKYWIEHQIHFEEGQDIPHCHWCNEYNRQIP